MTRSLRTRWTLALVAVCLIEALLVAAAVRVTTTRAFERFVIEEAFSIFVDRAEQSARATGTLSGAPLALRPVPLSPEARRPPDTRRPPGGRPPPGAPSPRRPRPHRLADGVSFGLADADGRVVAPFDDHASGDVLSDADLARGEPVAVDGRRVGTAFVPSDAARDLGPFPQSSPEARFLRSSSAALLWALAGSLALAVGLGFWLAGRTTRPLRDLTAAAGRITSGDLKQEVAVQTDDEVGRLAAAFNAMSERLAEANALRQRMTADVSHDLRTPLTAVLGILDAVASGVLPATPERLATAHAEAQRLGRMVDDLHTLALADAEELPVHLQAVEAKGALAHAVRLFEAEASGAGITLSIAAPEALTLQADPDRLAQILSNLIGNALRHTSAGGRITLSARASGETVDVSVADTGEGIPPEAVPHVFERVVRADAARSGTGSGLGLSIVRSLVEAMGGAASIESTLGEGTRVTVRLPRAEASGGSPSQQAAPEAYSL